MVRTIAFIEERVTAMLSLWEATELATMPMPPRLDRRDGELELTARPALQKRHAMFVLLVASEDWCVPP